MRGERSRVAAALAVSLLAHAIVLGTLRMPAQAERKVSPVAVVLTVSFGEATPASPARSLPPATVATPTSPPPQAPPPQPTAPVPPTAAATDAAVPPRAPPKVPATAAVVPASAPEPPPAHDQIFLTREQWTTPPSPRGTPDEHRLEGVRIVGRRLFLTAWIDDEGVVRRASVVRYELSPEVGALLEQMVMGVRFAPAAVGERAVGAEVTSHLCFDDTGRLDTSSSGCWSFDSAP